MKTDIIMIEAKTPCLLTALQELAEPRYMHAGGIIDAYAKDITVWGFDDLKDGLESGSHRTERFPDKGSNFLR